MRQSGAFMAMCAALAACGPQPQGPAGAPGAQSVDLISSAAAFAAPAAANVQLSPDGRQLAYLAPGALGAVVMLADVQSPAQARALTALTGRPIVRLAWAETGGHLIAFEAAPEGGTTGVVAIDLVTGSTTSLTTADESAAADFLGLSPAQPDTVLLAIRAGAVGRLQVISANLATGARSVVEPNAKGFSQFLADGRNRLRVARLEADGDGDSFWRMDARNRWVKLLDVPAIDVRTTRAVAVDADGGALLLLDSLGRDRAALVSVDLATAEKSPLGESPQADVTDVLTDPKTGAAQAFVSEYLRPTLTPLTQGFRDDLEILGRALPGELRIVSRSREDAVWVVERSSARQPVDYHLYDRLAGRLRPLFSAAPQWSQFALQPMTPIEIASRDGQILVSYLTLPPGADPDGDGRPKSPGPLALLIHDGESTRDNLGFRADHQFLAARGYAVLSVNYRGSVGFGKAFLALGDGAWGAGVQADLQDAAAWAIERGVSAPGRIGAIGAGLAGSAALTLLAEPQRRFSCAVAIDAPSDLRVIAAAPPGLAERRRLDLMRRLGDLRQPETSGVLAAGSPSAVADQMQGAALLIAGRDWSGPMRMLADGLRAARAPVALATLNDRPRVARSGPDYGVAMSVVETFLQSCLGGRALPTAANPRLSTPIDDALLSQRPGQGAQDIPAATPKSVAQRG